MQFATFVMINLKNRIGSGGIFVRRVDLTMGERKTKTVSASVKGLCSHWAFGPPNSKFGTQHTAVFLPIDRH